MWGQQKKKNKVTLIVGHFENFEKFKHFFENFGRFKVSWGSGEKFPFVMSNFSDQNF